MKLRHLLAGLSGLSMTAAVFTVSSSANAAPSVPCISATVLPRSAATIPANFPGFAYSAKKATEKNVHLFSVAGASPTEIPVTVGPVEGEWLKVAPQTPLVAGTSYRLEFETFCGGYNPNPEPTGPIEFMAGPEAPLPTKLADAVTPPSVTTNDFGTTQFTINASYSLAPEMRPWLDLYQVLVVVDGRLIDTKAQFAGGDTFTATATGWCDASNAATKKHSVVLRGRLPFGPTVETAAAELDFDCPAPNIATPANNPPVPPTGGTVQPENGNPKVQPVNTSTGGCSVSAPASRSNAPFAALGLGAIAVGLLAVALRRSSSL